MDFALLIVEALNLFSQLTVPTAPRCLQEAEQRWILAGTLWMANAFLATIKLFEGSSSGGASALAWGWWRAWFLGFKIFRFCLRSYSFGGTFGRLDWCFHKTTNRNMPGGLLPIVDQIDFVVGAVVFSIPLAID